MTITGHCHCGRNAFTIDADLPDTLTACTCSICAPRGALYAYFRADQFRIVRADSDAVYRWHSNPVDNHFCPICACSLYSDSPAFGTDGGWDRVTRRIGVNARLFDDFDTQRCLVREIGDVRLW